jgi:hypothetical protein
VKTTVVSVTTLVVAFATHLPAAALSGAFNFDGSITVTQNTITWQSDSAVPDQATIGATGLTGSFVGLGGTTITIHDLNRAIEPVNSLFAVEPEISFNAAPGLGVLDIDFIALGPFPSTDCHNPTPAPGQVCTLSSADVPGGSPFGFTNTASDGVHVDGSTAQFTFRGVTADGLSTWNGVFTAQFLESYQNVLATFFGPAGAVTNSYSAAVQVNVATPEPDTTIMLGMGLLAVSLGVRRFRKA